MISSVSFEKATFKEYPWKFEAGTQPYAQAYALGKAFDFLDDIGLENIEKHETELAKYAVKELACISEVCILGPKKRAGIISFTVAGMHAHDLATFLDGYNIAIRAGHHCAEPLHSVLGINASARVSFHAYTTKQDIDRFISALKEILQQWKNSIDKK